MAILAMLMAALAVTTPHAGASAEPTLQRLDGAQAPPATTSQATILLFWRSDCAPCLLELADLPALRRAAEPARVLAVGLQPTAALRPALARLRLSEGDTLRAAEDPAGLLSRLGGRPPRLPLTVAFRPDGALCGRRSGLLGADQVHAWSLACADADAAR